MRGRESEVYKGVEKLKFPAEIRNLLKADVEEAIKAMKTAMRLKVPAAALRLTREEAEEAMIQPLKTLQEAIAVSGDAPVAELPIEDALAGRAALLEELATLQAIPELFARAFADP